MAVALRYANKSFDHMLEAGGSTSMYVSTRTEQKRQYFQPTPDDITVENKIKKESSRTFLSYFSLARATYLARISKDGIPTTACRRQDIRFAVGSFNQQGEGSVEGAS